MFFDYVAFRIVDFAIFIAKCFLGYGIYVVISTLTKWLKNRKNCTK